MEVSMAGNENYVLQLLCVEWQVVHKHNIWINCVTCLSPSPLPALFDRLYQKIETFSYLICIACNKQHPVPNLNEILFDMLVACYSLYM
jgi:hypothetical protein